MSHRFVTTPLPEPAPGRSTAFYGRVVVLVVIASVIAVGSIAYTVSEVLSVDREPVPLQEWFIGSWGFIVSGERPPGQLVAMALLGIAIIGFTAVTFEVITSLMTISPRRRYLGTLGYDGRVA